MNPVDEFVRIKAEIRALKKKEGALRELFLCDEVRKRSNQHEVVVRQQKRRVFLRDKLPVSILSDANFWEDRYSDVVTVKKISRDSVDEEADIVLTE